MLFDAHVVSVVEASAKVGSTKGTKRGFWTRTAILQFKDMVVVQRVEWFGANMRVLSLDPSTHLKSQG